MKIEFLGGAETVTGSKYLVRTSKTHLLIDCGLFQGYKWLRERNRGRVPVDVSRLDAVVITHAHLDHSGYMPVLYNAGFRGPVFTHHATKALAEVLLSDSGHLQEEDAKYLAKHRKSKHRHPQPLYTAADALDAMSLFKGAAFNRSFRVGDIQVTFQPAGHILGAASVLLEAEGRRIMFSGDVGRPNDILMQPPADVPPVDHLVLESTYGNRRHLRTDVASELADTINETVARGGVLLVPSFAVGRTQALLPLIAVLQDKELIPRMPVYLDSPMAINVSGIYRDYHQYHRLDDEECARMCNVATFTPTVDESRAINAQTLPHIIIAGSGMATGGRILHHFKRLLGNHRCTVLFTGYQAGGTRGAKMLEGAESVRIHGEDYIVKAQLKTLHGLSGHADCEELLAWLEDSQLSTDTAIHLVHSGPEALEAQRERLVRRGYRKTRVAGHRDVVSV